MTHRVKNWREFQHYKNRRPAWIKVHRGLLDKRKFGALPDSAAKFLIYFWLVAAESGEDGELPPVEDLAYRLRTTEQKITKYLGELEDFIECCYQPASKPLATCYQPASPETEAERETERETEPRAQARPSSIDDEFDRFWANYPRKVGKKAARAKWKATAKERPALEAVLRSVERAKRSEQWTRDGGQYIPHPATWLSQGRWDDEPVSASVIAEQPKGDRWSRWKNETGTEPPRLLVDDYNRATADDEPIPRGIEAKIRDWVQSGVLSRRTTGCVDFAGGAECMAAAFDPSQLAPDLQQTLARLRGVQTEDE